MHKEKMRLRCFSCKKGCDGPEDVKLKFRGLNLKISKPGWTCFSCLKKEVVHDLKHHQNIVSIKNGSVIVNWGAYGQLHEDFQRSINVLLISLNVLSLDRRNNWVIIGCGVNIGPSLPMSNGVYFTRKEDAIGFAKVQLSTVLYGWSIVQFGEVVSRSDALKSKSNKN